MGIVCVSFLDRRLNFARLCHGLYRSSPLSQNAGHNIFQVKSLPRKQQMYIDHSVETRLWENLRRSIPQ